MKDEWISVEDVWKLPLNGAVVLLGNASWPRACIGFLKDAALMDWVGFLDQTEELPEGGPTHWQPLPKLPLPAAPESTA